jgi:hypothetical protein
MEEREGCCMQAKLRLLARDSREVIYFFDPLWLVRLGIAFFSWIEMGHNIDTQQLIQN